MPFPRLTFGRVKAFSLDCAQVQQARALHVADVAQHPHYFYDIVAVERPEIADIKSFEYVLLPHEQRLETVVEAQYGAALPVAHEPEPTQYAVHAVAQAVVCLGGGEVGEVGVERTHVAVDAHVVVVEHDEQIVWRDRSIIDAFESEASADRGIADDCHDIAGLFVGVDAGSYGHAESGADGVGRMAGRESVVFALGRIGKAAQTAEFAVGVESIAASCENLVPVGLMAHIPYEAVVRGIEYIVEGHGKFHRTHARCEVTGIDSAFPDKKLTDFSAHLRKRFHRKASQIGRRVDRFKQSFICRSLF